MPPTKLTPPRARHQDQEADAAERAVRRQHRGKERGLEIAALSAVMALIIPRIDGEKTGPQARRRARPNAGESAQGQGGAASKPARKQAAADAKAAHGKLPPWTTAEIEEAFRRFQAAEAGARRPNCSTVNPFTLLVAVVLSAQATDAGVNKATPALFALADTPEKMAALGEARVRDLIKTIGLFRTKAKNVVALSEKLVAEHGGQVPRTREALEALPGVGRKTANVVLNVAFGEPTIAVDTHIFRVGNRTGMAPGKTPFEVEQKLEEGGAGAIQAATRTIG